LLAAGGGGGGKQPHQQGTGGMAHDGVLLKISGMVHGGAA
jgi:hypothetical protein